MAAIGDGAERVRGSYHRSVYGIGFPDLNNAPGLASIGLGEVPELLGDVPLLISRHIALYLPQRRGRVGVVDQAAQPLAKRGELALHAEQAPPAPFGDAGHEAVQAALLAHGHIVAGGAQCLDLVALPIGCHPGLGGVVLGVASIPNDDIAQPVFTQPSWTPPVRVSADGYAAAAAAGLLRNLGADRPASATSLGRSSTSSEPPASVSSNLFWVWVSTAGCSSATA